MYLRVLTLKTQFYNNKIFKELYTIYINKTLYTYLKTVKEQIDCRLEPWDKYKKNTNPYEYIHTIIPNTKQSVSTLKPISRSFFKMIELKNK